MKELNSVIDPQLEVVGLGKNELAKCVDMTESGFYKMIRVNDMKVSTLEKISETLRLPITAFFDGVEKSAVNELVEELKRRDENNRNTIKQLVSTIEKLSLGKFSTVFQAVA